MWSLLFCNSNSHSYIFQMKYFKEWTIRDSLTEDDGSGMVTIIVPCDTFVTPLNNHVFGSNMESGASAALEQPLHSPPYLQISYLHFFKGLFQGGMTTNAFEKSCIWEYYGKRSTASKEQPLNPPQRGICL